MPEASLELQDVFWPPMYQSLIAKLVNELTAGGEAFDTQEIACYLNRISHIAYLYQQNGRWDNDK